jgi:hypothetical protein
MIPWCYAAGVILGLVGAASAQIIQKLSATSSVRVATAQDGTVLMRTRNSRFVPYVVFDREKHHPRLAAVTTDVFIHTDAEGFDPNSTVSITVDDLSGTEVRRLSSFSDPGASGEILGERYSVATMPCCTDADLHRVRVLETGRLLFRSTGPGATGTSAWAEVPNARPPTLRWAAFDDEVKGKKPSKACSIASSTAAAKARCRR